MSATADKDMYVSLYGQNSQSDKWLKLKQELNLNSKERYFALHIKMHVKGFALNKICLLKLSVDWQSVYSYYIIGCL